MKEYHSEKEIRDQHVSLRQTADLLFSVSQQIQDFFATCGEAVFVACGSSYWLSLSAAKTFSQCTGKRAMAVKSGDILLNPDEFRMKLDHPVIVCPSRSGMTTEQMDAVRFLKDVNPSAKVYSVIEFLDSPLQAMSDLCLQIPWAMETSVCQTRSFSNLYLSMVLTAAILAPDDKLKTGMRDYLAVCPELHARDFSAVKAFLDEVGGYSQLVVLGSGRQYGVAIEGAYIGIEMAQMQANYYGVMELRHGPIVTVGHETLVCLLSNGESTVLEEEAIMDAKKAGARVLVCIDNGTMSSTDCVLSLGGSFPPEATALHFIMVMQALAYHTALRNARDPDQPGDLVPFIQYATHGSAHVAD